MSRARGGVRLGQLAVGSAGCRAALQQRAERGWGLGVWSRIWPPFPTPSYISEIEYWVRVFVVKEWKFLTNKLLFTRMSAIMRTIPQEVICEIKQQSYSQWLKMESKGYT